MAEVSSLQKYLDTNINDETGNCYSFVCVGIDGDCVIPENVCIRFVDSNKITGITAKGNNVLNFDNCNFTGGQGYSFDNAVVNINDCKINVDMQFKNSKVYIANSTCSGKITLDSNSYCKTHKNLYQSAGAVTSFSITKNSKVESYKDRFFNYDGPLFNLAGKSFMKVSDPEMADIGQLTAIDDFSKFEVYNLVTFTGRVGKPFARVSNNSTIKVHGIDTLHIQETAFYLTDSFCFLNGLGIINVTDSLINAENSVIEIIRANNIYSTKSSPVFVAKNSTINLYDIIKVSSSGSDVFDLTDTELVYINNIDNKGSVEVQASAGSIVKSKGSLSKLYLNTIGKISSNGIGFNINGTTLRLTNITNVQSNSNVISSNDANSGAAQSNIILSDINSIKSRGGSIIHGNTNSKVFVSNIGSIVSSTNSFDITSGSLYLQYINSLVSSGGNVVNAIETTSIISDIDTCVGSTAAFILNSGSTFPDLYTKISNCKNITGNIRIGYTKATLDTLLNVQGKLSIEHTLADLTNVTVTELFEVSGESVVSNNNCTFNGTVSYTDSVINNYKSKHNGTLTIQNSVVNNMGSALNEITSSRDSSVINSNSAVSGSITLDNSSLMSLRSSAGSTTVNSRAVLLALSSTGTINTTNEGSFSGLVAALISGGGDLGISANNSLIDIRALNLKETLRATIDIKAIKSYTMAINGKSTITIDPALIHLKATQVYGGPTAYPATDP